MERKMTAALIAIPVAFFVGFMLGIYDGIDIAHDAEAYCAANGCLPDAFHSAGER